MYLHEPLWEVLTDVLPVSLAALRASDTVSVVVSPPVHLRKLDPCTVDHSEAVFLAQVAFYQRCPPLHIGEIADDVVEPIPLFPRKTHDIYVSRKANGFEELAF
ncbi:MAG TPA: hypothetical protein VFE27_22310 [Acidobacteriaceae bacterium]|nr:hypothetical protein [Acidobacteriaceae bacterium]